MLYPGLDYLPIDSIMRVVETLPVRDRILQHTQPLLMTRGYHGFSYRDVARLVGVKTSSIHYYFPTKEDLVLEAVNVYSSEVTAKLQCIDASLPPEEKLNIYAQLFGSMFGGGDKICLCGMLAADIDSLPDSIRQAVQLFFNINETWLTEVLHEGAAQGTLRVNGSSEKTARALYAAFQGSVLASRLFHSKARIDEVINAVKIV
jgi:TetR/AcrR family transcriptional repressor of nem operon